MFLTVHLHECARFDLNLLLRLELLKRHLILCCDLGLPLGCALDPVGDLVAAAPFSAADTPNPSGMKVTAMVSVRRYARILFLMCSLLPLF